MTAPRAYLDPRDHAFASGPVFERPESRKAAQALFDDPRDGDLLWELFCRWTVEGGAHLRLGLGARLIVEPGGSLTLGEHCVIRGVLRVEAGASLKLGSRVYVGDHSLISAGQDIVIGDDVLISHDVNIFDNDTHPADAEERRAHFAGMIGIEAARPVTIASAPILIGSGAWIGFGAAVMKGVAVGARCVVAAKSVVTATTPDDSVVAGNPARVVRRGDGGQEPQIGRGLWRKPHTAK